MKNKTALVTSAGSGTGKSIALAYAAEGANVVLSDINESHVQEVCSRSPAKVININLNGVFYGTAQPDAGRSKAGPHCTASYRPPGQV